MQVKKFDNLQAMSNDAANYIYTLSEEAIREKGRFIIALPGGSTPEKLYQLLSIEPYRSKVQWDSFHFFFGDERMVSPEDPLSNYYTAHRYLFSKLDISANKIHRIQGELKSALSASRQYEKHLKDFFDFSNRGGPDFDLVLLGMGRDGHTASLFPGDKTLCETNHWVRPVTKSAMAPFVPRVTMTLLVINQAQNVLFLVSGKEKQSLAEKIILQVRERKKPLLPAAMVNPHGNLFWYVSG